MYRQHYITSIKDINNKNVIFYISNKVIIRELAELLEECTNFNEISKIIDKRTFYVENNTLKFIKDLDELFMFKQMEYADRILYQDIIGLYVEEKEVLQ